MRARTPINPALKALGCQLGGLLAAIVSARSGLLPAGPWPMIFTQAAAATLLAQLVRSDRWWLPIHLTFLPLCAALLQAHLPPLLYLGMFVALLLVFRNTTRTRVPLYLSNRTTAKAVADLFTEENGRCLLDLGSGTGSLLTPLAEALPNRQLVGLESAPLPLAFARWRARKHDNLTYRAGDIFAHAWPEADCVYAFLSPAPMADVWQKALKTLKPGAVFISNSFVVPGIEPDRIIVLDDRRQTHLYIYRIKASTD